MEQEQKLPEFAHLFYTGHGITVYRTLGRVYIHDSAGAFVSFGIDEKVVLKATSRPHKYARLKLGSKEWEMWTRAEHFDWAMGVQFAAMLEEAKAYDFTKRPKRKRKPEQEEPAPAVKKAMPKDKPPAEDQEDDEEKADT